ncbi:cytochrome P450 [Bradyrhizobium sp. LM2.9]
MSFLGRLAVIKRNMIATWGQRAYEEDVIQGRFFFRNSFILNQPDAIRHVLLSNYENYSRTPAGIRMLRPVLGEGLLIAEGHAWTHQRRTLAPAFTPRATANLVPPMTAVLDETIVKLDARTSEPVDLREIMQRMTLEIAGRTMFSFGMDRHGPTLRNFVMEYGARLGRPYLLDMVLPLSWPSPMDFARARFRKRWTEFVAMLIAERREMGKKDGAPPRDLFDLMDEARDPETGKGFSDEQLVDEVATMILAGHETTATALFWALYLLALDPDTQEEVASETRGEHLDSMADIDRQKFTRAVIEETMRLYPPAFLIARAARENDNAAGRRDRQGRHHHDRAVAAAPAREAVGSAECVHSQALHGERSARPLRLFAVRRGAARLHRRSVRASRIRAGAGPADRRVPCRACRYRKSRDPARRRHDPAGPFTPVPHYASVRGACLADGVIQHR